MDCSLVEWWFDDYGVYRHRESWRTDVLVDEWCSFLHRDGIDEWDELHIYGHGNESGGDE